MKQIILIATCILLIAKVSAQKEDKFEYQLTPFGNYKVTPVFDQTKAEGKFGQSHFIEQGYIDSL